MTDDAELYRQTLADILGFQFPGHWKPGFVPLADLWQTGMSAPPAWEGS